MYDVVVVGAGHAGCEAANAASRLGLRTLVITLRADRIGWMSCNPAIGGIAKGQLVRELDALGGLMAKIADESGIQFRTLNESRGRAVQGSRVQCDRSLYARAMRREIEALPGLMVREGLVEELIVEGSGRDLRIKGVLLEGGEEIFCLAVILTTGTFLGGMAHIGDESRPCGREGERPAVALSASLSALGVSMQRFKTGTTPRLDGRTVDYEVMEAQQGDRLPRPFSFWTPPDGFPGLPQVPCHVTRTNGRTHDLVGANLHRSAVARIGALVEATRYCPSFEDKIRRFPKRDGHTVYIEPEGLDSHEVYPAGLSMSLPIDVQLAMLRTIKGLEAVEIARPGYAIEYDLIIPTQLGKSLELRKIAGLFCAGQINGTSGYEEAAAQGLMAGVNAARKVRGETPFVLRRDQAYIGVLVDDLCTVGTREPYRMFTSRAEHRLFLREDNADMRLCPLAHQIGMVDSKKVAMVEERAKRVGAEVRRLGTTNAMAAPGDGAGGPLPLATILRRPGMSYEELAAVDPDPELRLSGGDARTAEAEVHYGGYIARSRRRLDRIRELDDLPIPFDLDIEALPGLSTEVREKLRAHQPSTVGQASRISGITPAAIDILSASLMRPKRGCG